MRLFLFAIIALLLRTNPLLAQTATEPLLTPAQCRADIAFAFATMEDVHPNLYAWTKRDSIAKERARLEKSLTAPISRLAFWIRLAPLIARLRDGHTWLPVPADLWETYRDSGVPLFPLDTTIHDGKLFVRTTYGPDANLPVGAEISMINGISTRKILSTLMTYANKEQLPSREDQVANALRAELYLNFGMIAPFTIEYTPIEGKRAQLTTPGIGWQAIVAQREAQTQSATRQTFYRYRLLPDNIGLIEYERCVDLPKFEVFLKETFTRIQREHPRALIIDVRKNAGGQGGLNESLCEYITSKPYRFFAGGDLKISKSVKQLLGHDAYIERLGEDAWNAPDGSLLPSHVDLATPQSNPLRYSGQIYCLIGPGTFSNGMAFASGIKDCGLGTLVGEETGGLGSAYGDFITFALPNSHLNLNISLKHIFRPSRIDDGHGILPDFPVQQTRADTIAGRDTVLDVVRRKILSSRP